MGDVKTLVQEIFSWLKLQEESAEKLKNLANEMEERQKAINVTKVVGSSVSVGGAAALTVAGISVLTGGAAIPFIGAAATVASVAGVATNITSDLVGAAKSSDTMKEADKISEKMEDLKKKIQELVKSLREEWLKKEKQEPGTSPEDYVIREIVKEIARLNKFKMDDDLDNEMFGKNAGDSLMKGSILDFPQLSNFITAITAEIADEELKAATTAAMRAGAVVTMNVIGRGAEYAIKSAGKEAAEHAVKVTAARAAVKAAAIPATEQAARAAAKQAAEEAAKAAVAKAAAEQTARAAAAQAVSMQLAEEAAEQAAKAAVAKAAAAKAAAAAAAKAGAARATAKQAANQAAQAAAAKAAAKATAKAAGHALGGVIGLAFTVPELIINCKDLDKCDTNASRILRENAKAILTIVKQIREELDEMQKMFRRLAAKKKEK
ncbi:transcriptional regulatory protein AlgP-like [Mugil cephalus]|uniref:transcriptional regulatory protein AlgP-like n=1 Tax=Mugil cephalus TaxID=48193 RepID=UPI001FB74B81|nr:transcriptional regulatory protein AlgP-like [Mugil cephalus]XP_047436965.1 transcriptional regulatory protein AlgP-like [Mugil cephalus]